MLNFITISPIISFTNSQNLLYNVFNLINNWVTNLIKVTQSSTVCFTDLSKLNLLKLVQSAAQANFCYLPSSLKIWSLIQKQSKMNQKEWSCYINLNLLNTLYLRGHSNKTWHSKGGGFDKVSHKPFLHFITPFLMLLEVKNIV